MRFIIPRGSVDRERLFVWGWGKRGFSMCAPEDVDREGGESILTGDLLKDVYKGGGEMWKWSGERVSFNLVPWILQDD